jgi:hypothetical protein
MWNASMSSSLFTRPRKSFPVYIHVGEKLPHLHSLMEEFLARNQGLGPHCCLYSGLMAGPSVVLTREVVELHKFICCVDCPPKRSGLSVGA